MTATVVMIIILVAMLVAATVMLRAVVALANPTLLNEVDGLAACVVAAAVLRPVLLVDDRHVKVDRCLVCGHRPRHCDNRLRVDDRRWRGRADVDPRIDA